MQELASRPEESVESIEAKYLEYLKEQGSYYSSRTKKNKRAHQYLLVFSTVGAIIVPILVATPEVPKWIPIILSGLVSIAIAIENVFHFGDNWHSFRQTREELKQEKIFYDYRIGPYANISDTFTFFVERCQAIMSTERVGYFEINKQKNQDAHQTQTTIVGKN